MWKAFDGLSVVHSFTVSAYLSETSTISVYTVPESEKQSGRTFDLTFAVISNAYLQLAKFKEEEIEAVSAHF